MQQNRNFIRIDLITKLLLVLASLCILFLVKIVFVDNNESWDNYFVSFAVRHRGDSLSSLMFFFTRLGDHDIMIGLYVLLTLFTLFYIKDRLLASKIVIIALSTVGLMHLLKLLFKRARPLSEFILDAAGYSFPSGHTMNSLVFFCVLIFLSNRLIKNKCLKSLLLVLFIFAPLMIGFSRIYLGVHFFTDILAGVCFGYIWFYISNILLDKYLIIKKLNN